MNDAQKDAPQHNQTNAKRSSDVSTSRSDSVQQAAGDKVRLKFRVSQFESRSSTSAKWTEKWGVGLFPHEEFHATDQLLKLPFVETPPKSVCVFSVADTLLRFRMLDEDRISEVNGVPKKESLLVVGDRVRIGDGIVIEVLVAPGKPMSRSKATETSDGPTLMLSKEGFLPSVEANEPVLPAVENRLPASDPVLGAPEEDGSSAPTPMAVEEREDVQPTIPRLARSMGDLPEIQEPSLQTELRRASQAAAERSALSSDGRSGDRTAHTVETVRPELIADLHSPRSGNSPFLMPEPKVELADVPHAVRDDSLKPASVEEAPVADGIEPLYAEQAPLDEKPTLAERLLAVVAKVLRRDDLNPPQERFPLDAAAEAQPEPSRRAPGRAPEPWNPGRSSSKAGAPRSASSRGGARGDRASSQGAQHPEPWALPRESAAARRRGRALVFLVAACGALMLAVGIFRIVNRVQEVERQHVEERSSSLRPLKPGVPIEDLQEKVRRMQRR